MSVFKAVLFDYDGTLFDTRPAIVHCIRRAFEECAQQVPAPEPILETVRSGLPLQDTFVVLDGNLRNDHAALYERVRTYRTIYLDEATPLLRPFAKAGAVLQKLHAGGTKCIIVSNKGIAAIRRSLDENGLSPFVELVLGDEPGWPKKPDPAVLTQHILPRYTQLQSQELLMVGDTEIDIIFAKRSGMSCCWASYGYGEMQRCRALGPEYEISRIEELLQLVHKR